MKRLPLKTDIVANKNNADTLAGILWTAYQSNFQKITQKYPDRAKEIGFIELNFLRWLEPWPDWVLKIAAETLHVYFPKIQREEILDFLIWSHWFFLEAKIHGEKTLPPVGFPRNFRRNFILFFGHFRAHFFKIPKIIADAEAANLLSAVSLNEIKDQWGNDSKKMGDLLRDLIVNTDAQKHSSLIRAISDAEANTFDDDGQLQDTPATEIYMKILISWPEVELMSGPAKLCEFLDPTLGKMRSPEQKYDLVKKLCRRMGINFRPDLSRDKRGA